MLHSLVRKGNGVPCRQLLRGIIQPADLKTEEDKQIVALVNRWQTQDDCDGKRLVMKIVDWHGEKNPAIEAILSDQLDQFKLALVKQPVSLLTLFEVACLYGAELIADYLTSRINILDSKYAVAYATSSGKVEFAIKTAQLAKDKGLQEPPPGVHLYGNCGFAVAECIVELFNSSTQDNVKKL